MATRRAQRAQREYPISAAGMSIAVVASTYHTGIVERLVSGASDYLLRCGLDKARLHIDFAPGAWEIPLLAQRIARSKKVDAIICLGVVIRGETSHFDIIARESAQGIARVMLDYGIPISNGILAVDTEQQALDRAGGKLDNKGEEAAAAALQMVHMLRTIDRKMASSLKTQQMKKTPTKQKRATR